MTLRLLLSLALLGNCLAVSAAVLIYHSSGANHFEEGGFITRLSALQLAVTAGVSYGIFQIRRGRGFVWRDASAVWVITALGFLFLAADDLFLIHEDMDRRIRFAFNLPETGLTDRIDDLLVGLYGIVGVGVLLAYREEWKPYRQARPFLTWGFILLFLMVALDLLTNRNDILPLLFAPERAAVLHIWLSHAEDGLKVFAEALFLGAFYSVWQNAKRR